jgi:putative RecB family exonuclease
MTMYSHSRLQTFQNCPLQYKLRYIDRVSSDREGIEAFMGNLVHKTMEKLYRDLRLSKLNELEDLINYYRDSWERSWHDGIFVVKKDYTPEHYRDTGERCIRSYYEREFPFEDGSTLWLEEQVLIPLDSAGKYRMRGVVDRLVDKGGGLYEIHDYKTSGSIPSQEQADSDRQLALYQLAVMKAFSDIRDIKLVWHYLVFDKDITSERSEEDLKELKRRAIALIEVVERATEFEPKESALCEWCDYPDLCSRRKHILKVEDLPPKEFKEEDGVKLTDIYMELKEREGEIKGQIEELRAQIAEYCEAMQYERLRGTEYMLTVKRETKPSFPKSSSKERASLEDLIRELGRWEETSALNTSRLGKILRERSWPEEQLCRIDPFVDWEDSVTIRPKKAPQMEE